MNRSPYWPQSALKPLTLAVLLALPGTLLAAEATDAESTEATTSSAEQDAPKLKTVVVTARRREEAAQDVPTPITTLTGANLETQKVYRIQDLQQALPSVNVAYVHARVSSLAVRGIGNIITRPVMAWKAAPGCTWITSTSAAPAWPRSTCWMLSSLSYCVVHKARCSAKTPRPGC